MDWREHYKRNLVAAEEAVKEVKSGDLVALTEPKTLIDALVKRREELRGTRVVGLGPSYDPGWLAPGWDNSFVVTYQNYMGEVARPAYYQRLIDYYPMLLSLQFKPYAEGRYRNGQIDVFMTTVSPPDEHGYCSFGDGVWDRRRYAQTAKTVLAQVDASFIRTYGTNYIHVSEIDRFVEHNTPQMSLAEAERLIAQSSSGEVQAELRKMAPLMGPDQRHEHLPKMCLMNLKQLQGVARGAGWVSSEAPEGDRRIAQFVSEVVRDGDTIQIGIGTPGGFLPRLGAFDQKKDLGLHSEMGARGFLKLVEKGIINGSRKTIHQGKAVLTGLYGCGPDEIEFAAYNPLVELYDAEYVVSIRTAAANDNFVSINNAIAIDLSGQINAETIDGKLWNGTGGQTELHISAVLSRGGRAITLVRSTAAGGTVSRFVAQHPRGTAVTIPRTFADVVISEYGVARLLGKSLRERARELISIAHPDFRSDLKKAADQLLYP